MFSLSNLAQTKERHLVQRGSEVLVGKRNNLHMLLLRITSESLFPYRIPFCTVVEIDNIYVQLLIHIIAQIILNANKSASTTPLQP